MTARRWTRREDELLLVRAMALDEAAEHLGRTLAELAARAAALDVDLEPPLADGPVPPQADHNDQEHKHEKAAGQHPKDPADLLRLSPTPKPLADLDCERSPEAMDADEAERVARRVALALYRGSIEVARDALDDGWREHAGAGPLPQGAELLDLPLARVIPNVRVLNTIEAEGINTVGQFVEAGRDLLEHKMLVQIGDKTAAGLLGLIRELRVRAGLDSVGNIQPAASEQPSDGTVVLAPRVAVEPQVRLRRNSDAAKSDVPLPRGRGRRKSVPAVADQSPEMRRFCEEATVRLLPLIETIARSLRTPLPIEDLIQEGAKACFEALPRYDPNKHQSADRKPVKIETFVAPRIRGAMLDYARRSYLTTGGGPDGSRRARRLAGDGDVRVGVRPPGHRRAQPDRRHVGRAGTGAHSPLGMARCAAGLRPARAAAGARVFRPRPHAQEHQRRPRDHRRALQPDAHRNPRPPPADRRGQQWPRAGGAYVVSRSRFGV